MPKIYEMQWRTWWRNWDWVPGFSNPEYCSLLIALRSKKSLRELPYRLRYASLQYSFGDGVEKYWSIGYAGAWAEEKLCWTSRICETLGVESGPAMFLKGWIENAMEYSLFHVWLYRQELWITLRKIPKFPAPIVAFSQSRSKCLRRVGRILGEFQKCKRTIGGR